MSALAVAARSNDSVKVAALLNKSADDVDRIDFKSGKNPLHVSAEAGSLEVARLLIEHKADVNFQANSTTHSGWTPLHFAYEKNNQDIVSLLLENGADETLKNFNEEEPKARLEVWKRIHETRPAPPRGGRRLSLKQAGMLVRNTGAAMKNMHARPARAVHYSKAHSLAQRGKARKLKKYLADQHKKLTTVRESPSATSLPQKTTKSKNKKLVEEFGIDDYDVKTGLNALHIAANTGSLDVCKVLVEAKASLGVKSCGAIYQGWTALHFAFRRNATPVIEYLLAVKADPNAETDAGVLPSAKLDIYNKEQAKKAAIMKIRLMTQATKQLEREKQSLETLQSRVCQAVKSRSLKKLRKVIQSKNAPNLNECERSTGFAGLHYACGTF